MQVPCIGVVKWEVDDYRRRLFCLAGTPGTASTVHLDPGPVSVYQLQQEKVSLLPPEIYNGISSKSIVWFIFSSNQSAVIPSIGLEKIGITQIYKKLWVTFTKEINMIQATYKIREQLNYTRGWATLYLGGENLFILDSPKYYFHLSITKLTV